MNALPLIVFDVNETLLDLTAMEPTFERIFHDKGAMRFWFANLILYSSALTAAGCYVMYITANGRALPCCIAPFSQRGYENYTLGDATQQSLREIWTGDAYRDFRKALLSDKPPGACAGCGLRWSL